MPKDPNSFMQGAASASALMISEMYNASIMGGMADGWSHDMRVYLDLFKMAMGKWHEKNMNTYLSPMLKVKACEN